MPAGVASRRMERLSTAGMSAATASPTSSGTLGATDRDAGSRFRCQRVPADTRQALARMCAKWSRRRSTVCTFKPQLHKHPAGAGSGAAGQGWGLSCPPVWAARGCRLLRVLPDDATTAPRPLAALGGGGQGTARDGSRYRSHPSVEEANLAPRKFTAVLPVLTA